MVNIFTIGFIFVQTLWSVPQLVVVIVLMALRMIHVYRSMQPASYEVSRLLGSTQGPITMHAKSTQAGLSVIRAHSLQERQIEHLLHLQHAELNMQRINFVFNVLWGTRLHLIKVFVKVATLSACMLHRGHISTVVVVMILARLETLDTLISNVINS